MRITSLFLLLGFLTLGVQAQDYASSNPGWYTSVEDAYSESKRTGKPIMANFTGSDWCGWCKRLTRSVFIHDEFAQWAEENVVLLELDFPRRKQLPQDLQQQNHSMQRAFGIRGYPTIWLFDLDKDDQGQYQIRKLDRTGYAPSVKEFTTKCDQIIAKRA